MHMVTTTKGGAMGSMMKKIGGMCTTVPSPMSVGRYNIGMQRVDQCNQLRAKFSVASHHGVKKYYHKIILALLDFAVVQAGIHYFLDNP